MHPPYPWNKLHLLPTTLPILAFHIMASSLCHQGGRFLGWVGMFDDPSELWRQSHFAVNFSSVKETLRGFAHFGKVPFWIVYLLCRTLAPYFKVVPHYSLNNLLSLSLRPVRGSSPHVPMYLFSLHHRDRIIMENPGLYWFSHTVLVGQGQTIGEGPVSLLHIPSFSHLVTVIFAAGLHLKAE